MEIDKVSEEVVGLDGVVYHYVDWKAKLMWAYYKSSSINRTGYEFDVEPNEAYTLITEYKRRRREVNGNRY